MGSLQLLVANHNSSNALKRVFVYQQVFYSIFKHRRKQIVFGERPESLSEEGIIDQKVWNKNQTHLQRLENFPLKKAAYYRQLQESTGVKSVRGLSEITGEDWSCIARTLKVLSLPAAIQEFLRAYQEPAIVKHFQLRALLAIVRLSDESAQILRFRQMIEEIDDSSSAEWNNPDRCLSDSGFSVFKQPALAN